MRKEVLAAAPALAFVLLCVGNLRRASATVDEANHLHAGYRALTEGDFTWNTEHPPLGKMLAALPLLAASPEVRADPPSVDVRRRDPARARETFDAFVFRDNGSPETLLLLGRLPVVALGLALCLAVGRVAQARHGGAAGLLALLLATLDPNLLAHSGLVTTDVIVALFSFLSVVLFSRALDRRAPRADAAAGLVLGLALASKHTALLLLPLLAVLALVRSLVSPRGSRMRPFLSLGVGYAAAFLVLWACHGFETGAPRFEPEKLDAVPRAAGLRSLALALNESPLPMPSYLWGLRYNVGFSRQGGWPAFFLGHDSAAGGFLAYYPVALAVKTPLGTLALLAASFALRGPLRLSLRRDGDLLLAASAFLAAAVFSRINIGLRHVLPVYPFLWVLASRVAPAALGSGRPTPRLAPLLAIGACVLALGASTLASFPRFLAYFNEAAGGAEGGRRILLDSNLDWGQGLIELRETLAARGIERVKLHYFGSAPPEAYGISWEPMTREEELGPAEGAFAVSVMSLANVRADPRRFAWLEEREPVAKVGHTIWLWDLRGGSGR
ncbi:MAG: glycosyltransferase family 39 protein [Planctomycetes bacterium]|nr:glycosyltransferase family 39 protein [Planctomycetota bacterium]